MAKNCTYCGGEMHNSANICDHCGISFETHTKNIKQSIFVYYINAIKLYSEFNGRCKRKDYWMFMLVNFLIISTSLSIGLVLLIITLKTIFAYIIMILISILSILYSAFILFPILSISVRRLHDQDRSGLFLLFNFIPWLGNLALIILMALPATPYDNRYGAYTE